MISATLFYYLLAQITTVSFLDFRSRRIKNFWPALNFLSFLVIAIFVSESVYKLWWMHLQIPLGALVVGFLLFWIRVGGVKIMGGGDGKYLASLFLLMPTPLQLPFLESILVVTVLVAGILFLMNVFKNFKFVINSIWLKQFNMSKVFGTRFPFAPLILVAWLWLAIERFIS